VENGVMVDLSPLQAFANPAWAHQVVHGTAAAYVATGFAMGGIYALAILRGRTSLYYRKALTLSLAVGTLFLPVMLASGDWAASHLARHQPAKLAAAEAHFHTRSAAPLVIGGWPDVDQKEVRYGIEIPWMLSLLAFRDPNAVVLGLDAFPAEDIPDPRLVHPFFAVMVGAFFLMAAAALGYWWRLWRRPAIPLQRGLLWAILLTSPLGLIALEAGWLVTEFGRQPWIIVGHMRVSEGVTPNDGIGLVLLLFSGVYVLLSLGLLKMLVRYTPVEGLEGTQEGRRVDP
jgi:cytochrome bd ubiquinol oxidase subunit I